MNRNSGHMGGIKITHGGKELSLEIQIAKDAKSFKIILPDGVVKKVVAGKRSSFDLVCPSVEGTAVWCRLASGRVVFYESKTGKKLKSSEVKKMKISLYC